MIQQLLRSSPLHGVRAALPGGGENVTRRERLREQQDAELKKITK
jgi:hypothetical protein